MAERVIKIIIPQSHMDEVMAFLKEDAINAWREEKDASQSVVSVLSNIEQTESITDMLRQKFGHIHDFQIIVQAVEASIPHQITSKPHQTSAHTKKIFTRISREELYSDIEDGTRLSDVFIVMTILSTVVATVGLLRNNVAVIIGAMVIAPLLGPNVALALATTLADAKLGWQAAKSFIAAGSVAFCLACLIGIIMDVDPSIPEIANRTTVGIADIVLALAAGCAGVLAFTTGASGAVIGVMVAVALLPPLAVTGLLLGDGNMTLAMGAFLLFICNVICVNLAGVLTFLIQGIRPRSWWEAHRAKRATRIAIGIWLLILIMLSLTIYLISD